MFVLNHFLCLFKWCTIKEANFLNIYHYINESKTQRRKQKSRKSSLLPPKKNKQTKNNNNKIKRPINGQLDLAATTSTTQRVLKLITIIFKNTVFFYQRDFRLATSESMLTLTRIQTIQFTSVSSCVPWRLLKMDRSRALDLLSLSPLLSTVTSGRWSPYKLYWIVSALRRYTQMSPSRSSR